MAINPMQPFGLDPARANRAGANPDAPSTPTDRLVSGAEVDPYQRLQELRNRGLGYADLGQLVRQQGLGIPSSPSPPSPDPPPSAVAPRPTAPSAPPVEQPPIEVKPAHGEFQEMVENMRRAGVDIPEPPEPVAPAPTPKVNPPHVQESAPTVIQPAPAEESAPTVIQPAPAEEAAPTVIQPAPAEEAAPTVIQPAVGQQASPAAPPDPWARYQQMREANLGYVDAGSLARQQLGVGAPAHSGAPAVSSELAPAEPASPEPTPVIAQDPTGPMSVVVQSPPAPLEPPVPVVAQSPAAPVEPPAPVVAQSPAAPVEPPAPVVAQSPAAPVEPPAPVVAQSPAAPVEPTQEPAPPVHPVPVPVSSDMQQMLDDMRANGVPVPEPGSESPLFTPPQPPEARPTPPAEIPGTAPNVSDQVEVERAPSAVAPASARPPAPDPWQRYEQMRRDGLGFVDAGTLARSQLDLNEVNQRHGASASPQQGTPPDAAHTEPSTTPPIVAPQPSVGQSTPPPPSGRPGPTPARPAEPEFEIAPPPRFEEPVIAPGGQNRVFDDFRISQPGPRVQGPEWWGGNWGDFGARPGAGPAQTPPVQPGAGEDVWHGNPEEAGSWQSHGWASGTPQQGPSWPTDAWGNPSGGPQPTPPPPPQQGYDPRYQQSYGPGYQQGYDPRYQQQSYGPGYQQGYDPRYQQQSYGPGYQQGYDPRYYQQGYQPYEATAQMPYAPLNQGYSMPGPMQGFGPQSMGGPQSMSGYAPMGYPAPMQSFLPMTYSMPMMNPFMSPWSMMPMMYPMWSMMPMMSMMSMAMMPMMALPMMFGGWHW